jgi:hypothetical protein
LPEFIFKRNPRLKPLRKGLSYELSDNAIIQPHNGRRRLRPMNQLALAQGANLIHPDKGSVAAINVKVDVEEELAVIGVNLMDAPHAILLMTDNISNLESLTLTHVNSFH